MSIDSRETAEAQERINHYWSERAADYHAFQQQADRWESDRAAWGEALRLAAASIRTDQQGEALDALDVGTGSGYLATLLAEQGHRVEGIDLAEGMLEQARASVTEMPAPPSFRVGDAMRPPFEPGSFDLITARFVVWTLLEPQRALEQWRGLLRPGGIVAVIDSTWFPDGIDASDHPRVPRSRSYDRWLGDRLPLAEASSIDETAKVMEAAGLEGVEITPLHEIYELDDKWGVAPGHQVQMKYLLTGRAPQ